VLSGCGKTTIKLLIFRILKHIGDLSCFGNILKETENQSQLYSLETMTYLKGLLFTETMIVIDPQGIIIYKNNDMFERITMDY
jgi:ABC-type transporter Mla maintaining outer membrane lipid asymmetry ATPase subunit MlaF